MNHQDTLRHLCHTLLLLSVSALASCQLPTRQELVELGFLAPDPQHVAPAPFEPGWGGFAPQPSDVPTGTRLASRTQPVVPLDERIVGSWSRSESFGSGDGFGGALRETLLISGDGTFTLGAGDFVGGGGAAYGGSPAATGRWATSNETVYIHDGSDWEAYARYYTEPQKLMFTFADGSRQIWYRS